MRRLNRWHWLRTIARLLPYRAGRRLLQSPPPVRRRPVLSVGQLEDRLYPGSVAEAFVAAALGGAASEPITAVAGAVGFEALLGAVGPPADSVPLTTEPVALAPFAPESGVDLAGEADAPSTGSTPPADAGANGSSFHSSDPLGDDLLPEGVGLSPYVSSASEPAVSQAGGSDEAGGAGTGPSLSAGSVASSAELSEPADTSTGLNPVPAPSNPSPAVPTFTAASSAQSDPFIGTNSAGTLPQADGQGLLEPSRFAASSAVTSTFAPESSGAGSGNSANLASRVPGDTLKVPCAFGPGLDGWTVTESGGTALGKGTAVAEGADFVLREGDSFATTVYRDLTLSANPGWVVFEYSGLAFDESDPDSINDAFEVALLDSLDKPLVSTIGVGADQPRRDAYFNVTESVGIATGSGVEVIADPGDPSVGTVRLDVSKLAPGGTARIVFRLVNNDSDTGTTVRIVGCADVPPVVGVDLTNDTAPTGPGSDPYRTDRLTSDPRVSGTATDDNGLAKLEARVGTGAWSDITASLQPDGSFSFDPGSLPAGAVSVTIRATDSNGQESESTTSFVVNAAPLPAISRNPAAPGEGDLVAFDGAGTTDAEGVFAFRWTLSDGSTVSGATASERYLQDGSYPVALTVVDTAGVEVSTSVAVPVANRAPSVTAPATVSVNQNETFPLAAAFVDPGVLDTHTATVIWAPGVTSPATVDETGGSGTATASHAFSQPGVYVVTVAVTDDAGAVGTATVVVTVNATDPRPTIAGPTSVLEGSTYTLSLSADTPPGVDSWTIQWGDGTSSTVAGSATSATHFYADNGAYAIAAAATNSFGSWTANGIAVSVGNVAPAVTAGPNRSVAVNTATTFSLGSFTDPGFTFAPAGTSETFTATVDWGDGSAVQSVTPSVTTGAAGTATTGSASASHTFTTPDSYTVRFTVTDDDGGTRSATFLVTVTASAPVVLAAGSPSGSEGSSVNFSATFTDVDPGDLHTATIAWGDGTTSTGTVSYSGGVGTVSGSHVYADNGSYTVTVTVTDRYGLSGTRTSTATIANVAPSATPASPQTATAGQALSLTAATFTDPGFSFAPAGTVETFAATIDWGDGSSSTATATVVNGSAGVLTAGSVPGSHTYAAAGTYTVTVTVTDDDGGTRSATFPVTVTAPAAVKFFVVDQSAHATFRYGATGSSLGSTDQGQYNSRPRGIAATAAGDTLWVVDARKDVFVYTAAGVQIGRWAAGGVNQPQDIATDGTHVWLVDDAKDEVTYYANAAGRRSGSQNPTSSFALHRDNKNPSGMVVRDGTLWVTDDGPSSSRDKVYVYSLAGQYLGRWELDPANSDPSGITLNPGGGTDLWVVDRHDARVYRYTNATGLLAGSATAANSFALDAGNQHAEGIADPPVNWVGGSTGFWDVAANWSGGAVPTAADDVTLPVGVTVTVRSGAAAAYSISGGGSLAITGGTLSLAAASTVGSFVQSNGTLAGSGDLTVSGALTWTGGTMSGTGATVVAPGGTLALTGAGSRFLASRTLRVAGTGAWTDGGLLYLAEAARLEVVVGGSLDLPATGSIIYWYGAASTFANSGTVTKSMGSGTFSVGMGFVNDGQVSVGAGTLSLSAGGSGAGTWSVASGANLTFASGSFALANASLSGIGSIGLAGGAVEAGTGFAPTGVVTLSSGSLTLASSTSLAQFNQTGGTLSGTGSLTVSGSLGWTGGTMSGPGSTVVSAGGTLALTGTGSRFLASRTLRVAGTGSWTDGGLLYLAEAARLEVAVGGSLSLPSNGSVVYWYGSASTFANSGTVSKATGAGTFSVGIAFANDWQVNLGAGTLSLTAGGSGAGTWTAANGATLTFASGTFSLAASVVSGSGTIAAAGGAVEVGSGFAPTGSVTLTSGSLSFSTPTSLVSLVQSGGTLAGSADLTVTGSLTWTGGTMTGTGATVVAPGGTLALSGTGSRFLAGRTLRVAGTGTWADGGLLYLAEAARLDVAVGGSLALPSNGSVVYWYGAASTFANAGTVTKAAGTGTFSVGVTLTNAGQLDVATGTLSLSAGGSGPGTWAVATGANLTFASGSFALANATVSGAGSVGVTGGAVEAGAGFTPTGLITLSSGSLTLATSAAVSQFTQSGGTLAGSGDLTATGAMIWTGGTMTGTGATVVAPGGTLALSGTGSRFLASRTLRIAGTGTWIDGGLLYLAEAARLEVAPGGSLGLTANGSIVFWYGAASTFANAGTVTKSTGAGSFSVGVAATNASTGRIAVGGGTLTFTSGFANAGTVEIGSGATLSVGGGNYSQTAGETALLGGTMSSAAVALAGGQLAGFGTVNAAVTNAGGTVRPEGGTLAVAGGFTQGAGGSFALDLTVGGHLAVAGDVSLAGTVTLSGTESAALVGQRILIDNDAADSIVGSFVSLPEGTPLVVGGEAHRATYLGGTGNDLSLRFALPVRISGDDRAEGDDGFTAFTFPVTLPRPYASPVTVGYVAVDGTATAADDYEPVEGVVEFAPGETTRFVTVRVRGDRAPGADETFLVRLTASGADFAPGSVVEAVGTIRDDDSAAARALGSFTLTSREDFREGSLNRLDADTVPGELRLTAAGAATRYVNVAASARGTAVRIDADTGAILGEYLTAPNGRGRNPSRTTVDLLGNVWVANRDESEGGRGSVVRIGVVVGGTRGRKEPDGSFVADPAGEYLRGPFAYSTVVDRDGDGLIRTSGGLGNILGWTNAGGVDSDGGVDTAQDEAITVYTRVTGANTRTIAVTPNNDVWVGGTDYDHERLDGTTGLPVPGTQFNVGAGGYGGVVDLDGVLWSARLGAGLLRYDASAPPGERATIVPNSQSSYGVAVDPRTGRLWYSSLGGDNRLYELNPDGSVRASYPQPFSGAQGMAVGLDGHVWVAGVFGSQIAHWAPDPTDLDRHVFVGLVTGLASVTGVSVDSNGKVWAAEIQDRVSRIDPTAGPIGGGGYPVGAIELSVGLGAGAGPYNYSDMTGSASQAAFGAGTWTHVLDGGSLGAVWASVVARGYLPPGSAVEVRAADDRDALQAAAFATVGPDGRVPTGTRGGLLEVRITLKTDRDGSIPRVEDVIVDLALPPTIAVDSPPDGSSFPAGQTVLVTGLATAGNPTAPIASVTADGVPVAVDSAGRFFARIPLGPGTKAVRFVATDIYGQTAETIHTLVGTQAPVGRIDFSSLVEVGHVGAEYGRTSFDEDTHTLFADVTVRNAGTYAIGGPVLVGVRNLSELSVSVLAPDGYAPDGTPYFDLTARGLVSGDLAPGAAATAFALAFVNPNRVRFTYDLVLLGVPNRAPTFTSVPALDATAGRTYAYTAIATDPDGHPVAYSLAAGPVGMAVDPATGVLTWAPAAGDVGTHAVAVRATDGRGGSAVQTFTLAVTEPSENRPPVFASVPPVGGFVNVAFGYAPVVEDADGDALTFTLAGPAGMTVDPTTGVLAWTPTANQLGDSAVTVTVADGRGGSATQTFTVRVTPEPGNTPPAFVSPTTATTLVGEALAYAARAVDADGDVLTYSLVGTVPAGLTLTADGLVTWMPAAVGSFAFTVRAVDGRSGVAEQTVTVAVGSDAPVTLTGTAFADADADGVFDAGEEPLATWAVFVDGNGNGRRELGEPFARVAADGSYSLTGLSADTYSVALERVDGWVFTFPASGQRTVTAAAGETVAGLDFGAVRRLTPAANRDPVMTATVPPTVVAGQSFGFVPTASDADGDPINFDLPVGPVGMAVDPFTGRVVWVPTADQVGSFEGLLRVRDGRGGVAMLPFSVAVVAPNARPEITSQPTGPAVAGRSYEYRVAAQDADGDALSYSLDAAPVGMSIDPDTGILTWAPGVAQVGDHPVTVAVSDGRGGLVTQSFTLGVVVPVSNAAPVISSTPFGPATVGSPYRYAVSASDPDGDPISFALTTAPAGMSIDAATGVLAWTPSASQVDDHAVVIAVSDGRGGVTTQSFTLAAVPANAAPDITSTPVGPAVAGRPYVYRVTAVDPDGDPVAFAMTTAPAGMAIDPTTGVLTWTPGASQVGDHAVTIEVSDGRDGVRTQSFTLPAVADTPTTPNAPPVITSTPVGPARAGTPYRYAVTATDPNGDPVSFALSTAPAGMSIAPATGVLTWTPSAGQVGDHAVTVEVSDSRGGVRTQSFTLPVVADTAETPNAGPVVTSTPGGPAVVGSPYRYAVAATDADSDVLGFALGNAPAGMSIDASTGVVTWTPAAGQVGAFPVEIRVSDGRDTVVQSFTLPAIAADRPPAFATTPPGPAEAGISYLYRARAIDPDGDPVSYSLVGAPAGMSIDATTGVLTWTPAAVGTAAFTVRANARGVVVDQLVNLAVQASGGPNQSPVLGGNPTGSAVVGRPWTYAPTATDPDGDTVRFALPVGPAGMTVDPATGALSWIPTAGQVGSHAVTIRAIDARGEAVEQSFVLTAVAEPAPNRSPSVTADPARTATVGVAYQARISATDPDGDPLTFTAVTLPAGMSLSDEGTLTWTPTAAQVGDHPVSLRVSDGRGGEVSVSFSIAVTAVAVGNSAPRIVSTPGLYATVGTPYAYDARATDADGDAVAWSLDSAPAGASIDPARGTLRWTPTAAGLAEFVVRATDARGAAVTQRFGIAVAGVNSAPLISSTPVTRATAGQVYAYAVRAVDPDGDPVTFSLTSAPAGMTVDPSTGLIRWTPAAALVGTSVDVTVVASDNRGGSQPQSFRIAVAASATNRAPSFAFAPKQYAVAGAGFTDLAFARDPDGDPVTYSVTSGGDLGFSVNPTTGAISWTPPSVPAGQPYRDVVVGLRAADSFGAASSISYVIRVRPENQLPSIQAVARTTVTAGTVYTYDVLASDPDLAGGLGESLTYTVTSTGPMTIDPARGTLRLDASGMAAGTEFPVTVTVTDAAGATATTAFTLRVVADTTAPVVMLTVVPDAAEVNVGTPIAVRVTATDNVGVAGVSLVVRVNGGPWQTISLDSRGQGTFTPTSAGTWELRAEATDGANSSAATRTLGVVDPAVGRPVVSLATLPNGGRVEAPTAVSGSVTNVPGGGTLTWKLEAISRDGSGGVRMLATGTGDVTGHLGDFDPTILANGYYTLRLTATNAGGSSVAEASVEVAGPFKLGNFTVAFTDLAIPVAGIPITVTRVYDTLDAGKEGDFGYGWRLELGGYTVAVDRSTLSPYGAFQRGTRVSVRRADGTTDWYTFDPQPGATLFGIPLDYKPYYRPDPGVVNRLSSDEVSLRQVTEDQFVVVSEYSDIDYTPENFGGAYDVTEPNGLVYTIDARTGAFRGVKDRNDNTLTFTDGGIVSNRGVAVTFERDHRGRITAIRDPRGNALQYTYDAAGDLVAAVDRAGESLGTYEYLADPAHYLDAIFDAKGAKAVGATYDPTTGRLSALEDAAGESVTFGYGVSTDPNAAQRATQTASVPSTDNPGTQATTTVGFDGKGNVTRTVDAHGRVTLSTYNALRQPLEVRQVVGQIDSPANGETDDLVTTTVYDSVGNPIAVTAPGGAVTRTTYDRTGLPTSVIDPLGNPTYLTYDSKGNLLATRSAEGVTSAFGYDSKGNLTAVTRGGATATMGYDTQGRVTSTTDASGNVTGYSYDANGNRTGTTRTWVNPENPSDVRTLTTSVVYDGNDRVRFSTDERNNVTETRYDVLGRAFQSVDSLGNVTETIFDERGLAVETRSADGTVTRTAYDSQGRAVYSTDTFVPGQATVRGTHTVYDDVGQVVRVERLDGLVINVTVDAQGTGTAAVVTAGTVLSASETKYDALGRAFWTRDPAGLETTTYFDAAGRAYKTEMKVSATETLTTRTEFDAAGRVIVSFDAAGVPTYTTYDADGRVTKITFADGATQQTAYDSQGRRAFSVDEVGQRTDYGYDTLGRMTSVTLPSVADATTGLTGRPVFTYGYDKYGNQVSIADPYGRVTEFHFDEFGRSTGRTLPEVDGVLANENTAYDKYGNVDYSIDFNGQKADRVYDYNLSADGQGLGRMVETLYFEEGATTPAITMAYTYDALGRRDTVTETMGSEVRVTNYDFDIDGRTITIASPEGVVHYEYDDITGRQAAMWTSASRVEYSYDTLGRMTTVTEVMRNSVILSDPQVTEYAYTAVGQVDMVTVTSGTAILRETTSSYDADRHWLTGVVNEDGSGSVLSSFDYTRRADGQITQVVESVKQPDGSTVGGTAVYTYDAMNRLIQETYDGSEAGSDYTIEYGLDWVGNRVEKITAKEGQPVEVVTSQHDARDRLFRELISQGGLLLGENTFVYNANGSLTSQSSYNGGATLNRWDAVGRLAGAAVTKGGVTTEVEYQYDSNGIRSGVTENGVSTRYLLDQMSPSGYPQVVEEWSSGASGAPILLASFVYGRGLDPISTTKLSRDAGGAVTGSQTGVFLADGHSGVRQAVDAASGAVILTQAFDAFGNLMRNAGTFVTPIGYRGERWDAVTGTWDTGVRQYNPRIGRFGSMDSFSGNMGDPGQWMRYGYAGANPIWGMDPTGLTTLGGIAGFLGVSGLLTATAFGVGSTYGTYTGREAGFWEGFIPGWGSGRNFGAHTSQGSYWAFLDLGMGLTEIVGIGYLAKFVPPSLKSWASTRLAKLFQSNTATATGKLFANARGRVQEWVILAGREGEVAQWISLLQREYTRITGRTPSVVPHSAPNGANGEYDVLTRAITIFDDEAVGGVANNGGRVAEFWTRGSDGIINPPAGGVSVTRLEELFHWLQCHNMNITHPSQITSQVRRALEDDVGDFLIFVGCAPIR